MTDHPINLTDWQVRAALDGRLSLVVEPVNPQPPNNWHSPIVSTPLGATSWTTDIGTVFDLPLRRATGDRLWVREAHYMTDDGESEYAVFAEDKGAVEEHLENMQTTMASHPHIDWSKHLLKRSADQLPRWASRLTLIATDVKVMRVQDIGDVDGFQAGFKGFISADGQDGVSPREEFQDEWNAHRAKRGFGWDTNPWVTAEAFTVHRCNIDQMEAQNGNS